MNDHPELDEINRRFKPLVHHLCPAAGPCPFVADGPDAKQVVISHYSAGRDATYIHVSRKWDGKLPLGNLAVTIRYAPFVEGTAIIYDLVDETMQGKARPFACDLTHRFVRIYMLLPFQIERTSVVIHGRTDSRIVEVAFLDARDEVIQAALPFQVRLTDASSNLLEATYAATNRQGRFMRELAPGTSNVLVHSCLNGRDDVLS